MRKEVLSLQSDPRSPEHGQYGFLQDLVRHVAYETLSGESGERDTSLPPSISRAALTDEEVAEVVASHLVEAYELDPDAEDAPAIRERARLALVGAGERAERSPPPARRDGTSSGQRGLPTNRWSGLSSSTAPADGSARRPSR